MKPAAIVLLCLCALGQTQALESDEQLTPQAAAAVKKAVDWLGKNQKPDGSWPGGQGNTTGVVAACAIARSSASMSSKSGNRFR